MKEIAKKLCGEDCLILFHELLPETYAAMCARRHGGKNRSWNLAQRTLLGDKSYAETGRVCGVTRERARQAETHVLRKMRAVGFEKKLILGARSY